VQTRRGQVSSAVGRVTVAREEQKRKLSGGTKVDEDTIMLITIIAACLIAPVALIVWGLIGRAILSTKGYSRWAGFALGAIGGIVGIIVALVLPKATQPSTRAPATPAMGAPQPRSSVSPPPQGSALAASAKALSSDRNPMPVDTPAVLEGKESAKPETQSTSTGYAAKEEMHKCEICKKEFPESGGKQLTPRQLSRMPPKNSGDMGALIESASLQSVAASMVQFNNPPGIADKPIWWVCSGCLFRCFF
jgi:hypothetical protein